MSFPKPLYPLVHPAVLVETYEQGESVARFVDRPGKNRLNTALASIGTHTLLKMLLVRKLTLCIMYIIFLLFGLLILVYLVCDIRGIL